MDSYQLSITITMITDNDNYFMVYPNTMMVMVYNNNNHVGIWIVTNITMDSYQLSWWLVMVYPIT